MKEELSEFLTRQIKYGVQHQIMQGEHEPAKIMFAKRVKALRRPMYDKIKNDIYYFSCSYEQLF